MEKVALSLLLLQTIFTSCIDNNTKENTPISKSVASHLQSLDSTTQTIEKPLDTSKLTHEERVKKLIELSMIKDIENRRQELIAQSTKYNYNVSSIRKEGDTYEFEASTPDSGLNWVTTYYLKRGLSVIYLVGNRDDVDVQFRQLKNLSSWDTCEQRADGALCIGKFQIESYPILTHIKLSITYIDSDKATLTMQRLLTSKSNLEY